MSRLLFLVAIGASAIVANAPAAAAAPADPLKSPMWAALATTLFDGGPVVFDPSLRFDVPEVTENQRQFPVAVDARALANVQRIVVFSDLNPIPVAIDYSPGPGALPFVSVRIKLDQKTPVRAAVLTADGVWHVAGRWVDAAGGGCSAPPVSRVRGDWAQHLGELRGGAWREPGQVRLRVTLRHPMDTGLAANIPAYNLEEFALKDSSGATLATMTVSGAVAEDPAFGFLLRPQVAGPVAIEMRDSNGREFAGTIRPAT